MEQENETLQDIMIQNAERDAAEMEAYAESYLVAAALALDASHNEAALILAYVAADIKALSLGISALPYTKPITDMFKSDDERP